MNPWTTVAGFYGHLLSKFGMDSAAVLVCKIMEDNYADTMPAGANPWAWCLSQLDKYKPNPLVDKLARDWHGKANPHI